MNRMPRCRCRDGALHRATPAAARGPGRAICFNRSLGALARRPGDILAGWLADHARPGLQQMVFVSSFAARSRQVCWISCRAGASARSSRRSLAPGQARAHPEWPGPGALHSFDGRSDRARYLRHMLGSRIDEAPIAASRTIEIDLKHMYIYIYRYINMCTYIYIYIPCRSLVPCTCAGYAPGPQPIGRRSSHAVLYIYIYIYYLIFVYTPVPDRLLWPGGIEASSHIDAGAG